jgi:hypothetical protein
MLFHRAANFRLSVNSAFFLYVSKEQIYDMYNLLSEYYRQIVVTICSVDFTILQATRVKERFELICEQFRMTRDNKNKALISLIRNLLYYFYLERY